MTSFIDCYNNFKLTGNQNFTCNEGQISFRIDENNGNICVGPNIIVWPHIKEPALKNVILYIIRDTTRNICFPRQYNELIHRGIDVNKDTFYNYKFVCEDDGSALLISK